MLKSSLEEIKIQSKNKVQTKDICVACQNTSIPIRGRQQTFYSLHEYYSTHILQQHKQTSKPCASADLLLFWNITLCRIRLYEIISSWMFSEFCYLHFWLILINGSCNDFPLPDYLIEWICFVYIIPRSIYIRILIIFFYLIYLEKKCLCVLLRSHFGNNNDSKLHINEKFKGRC